MSASPGTMRALVVAGVVGVLFLVQPYSLAWNRTASIPRGLYLAKVLKPDASLPPQGSLLCFRYSPPPWAQTRGYFLKGFRLCKQLLGLPGDVLLPASQGAPMVLKTAQGDWKLPLIAADNRARPMPQDALKPGVVPANHVVMLALAHANSLDSRYLGPIPRPALSHQIWPIWTY